MTIRGLYSATALSDAPPLAESLSCAVVMRVFLLSPFGLIGSPVAAPVCSTTMLARNAEYSRGRRGERLAGFGDECRQPTVAMQQSRLAFTRASWDENIWRLALSAPGRPAGTPVSLSGSTRAELNAQFSPDGTRVVFESQRSGTQELWVADQDGRNALQLTSFNGLLGGTPAWSPDGKSIAFDLRNEDGRGDVYIIPARGGVPLQVTNHPADDLVPSWSHDGQSIYFTSTRTGRYQIWKVSRAIRLVEHESFLRRAPIMPPMRSG